MVSTSSALCIAALVAGVALMLVVHVVVIFWALRRGVGGSRAEEERGAQDGCGGGGQGLSAGELDTLPCYDFEAGGGRECAVCLEAFEAGDRCRRLPRCEHGFHASCVDPWLEKSRCCPVCRADVVVGRPKGERKVVGEGEAALAVETVEWRIPATSLEIIVER